MPSRSNQEPESLRRRAERIRQVVIRFRRQHRDDSFWIIRGAAGHKEWRGLWLRTNGDIKHFGTGLQIEFEGSGPGWDHLHISAENFTLNQKLTTHIRFFPWPEYLGFAIRRTMQNIQVSVAV